MPFWPPPKAISTPHGKGGKGHGADDAMMEGCYSDTKASWSPVTDAGLDADNAHGQEPIVVPTSAPERLAVDHECEQAEADDVNA